MMNQQQYHRRTFRGRGGPNDRKLPKHNAARRQLNRSNDEPIAPDVVDDDVGNSAHDSLEYDAVVQSVPDDMPLRIAYAVEIIPEEFSRDLLCHGPAPRWPSAAAP